MISHDREILELMIMRGGSFVSHLAKAAMYADEENLERLKKAFPDIWERYELVWLSQKGIGAV